MPAVLPCISILSMVVRHPQQGLTRLEIYAIIAIIVALLTYIVPVPQVAPRQNPVAEQEVGEVVELLPKVGGKQEGENEEGQ